MFGAFYGAPWLGSHSISGSMTSLQVAELRYFYRILLTIILNQNYAWKSGPFWDLTPDSIFAVIIL